MTVEKLCINIFSCSFPDLVFEKVLKSIEIFEQYGRLYEPDRWYLGALMSPEREFW